MELKTAPLPEANAMVLSFSDDTMSFTIAIGLTQGDDVIATLVEGLMEAREARHNLEQTQTCIIANARFNKESEGPNDDSNQSEAVVS